jgi:hypothetical protein
VAAGIDAGVISPSETLSEPQHISVGEYRITNWDFKSRGTLAISDILAKSSNIGMVQIGKKLKDEGCTQYEYTSTHRRTRLHLMMCVKDRCSRTKRITCLLHRALHTFCIEKVDKWNQEYEVNQKRQHRKEKI